MSVTTLTMNPAIDGASVADVVRPTRKIRTRDARYDPGGGGINVARVLHRLSVPVTAWYLAGGATGGVLDELLDRDGVSRRRLNIADHSRVSQAIFEESTGLEYRFVGEGPQVTAAESAAALAAMAPLACDWLVCSGSLPRGVPADFYARVAAQAAGCEGRFILDTSGEALAASIEAGGIFLLKPSAGELATLLGANADDLAALVEGARGLVAAGRVRHVAITLGQDGAVLVSGDGAWRVAALPVEARSATGAGDSFVAGMTAALCRGETAERALRHGIAAGSAAVVTPGTDLCHAADVAALLPAALALEAVAL